MVSLQYTLEPTLFSFSGDSSSWKEIDSCFAVFQWLNNFVVDLISISSTNERRIFKLAESLVLFNNNIYRTEIAWTRKPECKRRKLISSPDFWYSCFDLSMLWNWAIPLSCQMSLKEITTQKFVSPSFILSDWKSQAFGRHSFLFVIQ